MSLICVNFRWDEHGKLDLPAMMVRAIHDKKRSKLSCVNSPTAARGSKAAQDAGSLNLP